MTTIHELLKLTAGEPPPSAPIAAIERRGQELVRRRRRRVTAVLAGLVLLAVTVVHFTTSAVQPAKPHLAPVQVGPLLPGRYQARDLSPVIEFTVPEQSSWRAVLATSSGLIMTSDQLMAWIQIQHWTGVYPPSVQAATSPPVSQQMPADVIGWLATAPGLRVTHAPVTTELGGRPAHRISVVPNPHRQMASGPAYGCTTAADCVPVAETPDGMITVYQSDITTFTVPDDPGTGLIVTSTVPSNDKGPAAHAVQALLNTVLIPSGSAT